VAFNEEEKAIIGTRNVGNDYKLVLTSPLPTNAGVQPGSCSSIFLGFLTIAFLPLGVIFLIAGLTGGVVPMIVMGAIMAVIGGGFGVGWVMFREQGKIAYAGQTKTLYDLIAKPDFTVWYETRDAALGFDAWLRSELAVIKTMLTGHIEEKKTETFEL
jgi:hypothetical protein